MQNLIRKVIFLLVISMSASKSYADLKTIEVTSDVDKNAFGDSKAKILIKKIDGDKVVTIDRVYDMDDGTDVDQLIESLLQENNIKLSDAHDKRIIKINSFHHTNNNKPRLGFIASSHADGWDVLSVTPESGAAQAGLKSGDVILAINGEKTTGDGGLVLRNFIKRNYTEGDLVDVLVKRENGKEDNLTVRASILNVPDVFVGLNGFSQSIGDFMTFDKNGSKFTFKAADNIKAADIESIDVLTAKDSNVYLFSNSGMSKWLGKKHHFSSITPGLGKYFGTENGVLVLEVDADNTLGLQDGDVIQAINDELIHTPKDVVRQFKSVEQGEAIEIQIIRNKKKIYLAS